jgi:type VI secretion system secreted protein VgrG
MPETITQSNRLLAVYTPAGEDVLLLKGLTGQEAISQPFRFQLDLVADVRNNYPSQVKPHELVGSLFTVTLQLADGTRYISGYCERFGTGGQDDEFAHYTASIVPWFSFLSLSANCRIFQNKTVPDVVQQVISDNGFSALLETRLTKSYTAWNYCVQYRETDFAFISRLLEAEGIFYYFRHENGKHVMVLADAASCYAELPDESTFKYSPAAGMDVVEDTIRTWHAEERLHSGKWSLRDYHHEMPTSTLDASESSSSVADEGKKFEIYDYPGGYAKKFNEPASRLGDIRPEGDKLTIERMEGREATRLTMNGSSNCRAFCSGFKIKVSGGSAAGSYLLTSVSHWASQRPAYRTEDASGGYQNEFTCIDAGTVFRPLELTPKPVVYGLQTAVVVDESSSGNTEEIWPDKYGRVRVRFPWDRDSKYSCWLRVIQPWAGKAWGHQWLPRTGDEVAVSFLEGDPDCPVVVGSIYNADNMPIFPLPDHKTRSGILTRSTPHGGTSSFNMLRFEDKKGSEEIFVQAEKDLNSKIKHRETRSVGANQTITIGGNRSITVGGIDKDGNQHGDVKEKIVKNRNLHVMGDERIEIDNKQSVTVLGDSITECAGNRSTQVVGDEFVMAKTITLQAEQTLTLMVGASSIVLGPSGITILGVPMLNLNPLGGAPPIPPLMPSTDLPEDP